MERTAIGRAEQRRGQDTPARTRESDGGRGSEVPHRCHHGDPARFHFFLFAPRSALVAARTGAVGCALIRRGTRDCPTEPSLGQRAPPSSHPRPKGPHHAPRQRRSRCRRPPARPQPYLPSWCCCCCRRCCCDCSGETCQHAAHGQHFPNRATLQPCLPRITLAPRQQKQPKRLAMSARCLLQHTRGTHINVRRRRASQRVTSNSRSAKHKRAVKIGRPPERCPRRHETQGLARGVATGGRSVWPPRRESCGLLFFFSPPPPSSLRSLLFRRTGFGPALRIQEPKFVFLALPPLAGTGTEQSTLFIPGTNPRRRQSLPGALAQNRSQRRSGQQATPVCLSLER